jgi:hypothetical protein
VTVESEGVGCGIRVVIRRTVGEDEEMVMVLGQVKLATPMHLRNAAPPSQKISLPSDAHRRSSRKMGAAKAQKRSAPAPTG